MNRPINYLLGVLILFLFVGFLYNMYQLQRTNTANIALRNNLQDHQIWLSEAEKNLDLCKKSETLVRSLKEEADRELEYLDQVKLDYLAAKPSEKVIVRNDKEYIHTDRIDPELSRLLNEAYDRLQGSAGPYSQ